MKKNMGSIDKAIRIFVAAVIAVLYFEHIISGTLAIVLGMAAIIFVITSFMNFCPLYVLLGINTCKKKNN
ncbi:MAG: DUF2892 domain-containing protein [Agriterribacter sp.]